MHKHLEQYIDLVEFLGKALGSHTEVVLQDTTNLESSVVAIANGHISNRTVGAPATDLVLKILKNNEGNTNSLCNYTGTLKNGNTLRSSTYFIRDEEGSIIGMLCVNRDMSRLESMRGLLDQLIEPVDPIHGEANICETFSCNCNELTLDSIDSVINSFSIAPERMSYDEKLKVIEELHDRGIFLLKGAVFEVSKKLKVSEPTVYRYLGVIKKK